MKLETLSNNELESVLNMTEKCLERLGRDIRVSQNTSSQYVNELNKRYNAISLKYKIIWEEINKRIIDIEE